MELARSWEISLADISTAFLHAAIEEVVHVWPPKHYPEANCLWAIASRHVWSSSESASSAESLRPLCKLGFWRCRSTEPVLSQVTVAVWRMWTISSLLETRNLKEFIEVLSKERLVKITGELRLNTEHSFLGRKLRHNGDSVVFLVKTD